VNGTSDSGSGNSTIEELPNDRNMTDTEQGNETNETDANPAKPRPDFESMVANLTQELAELQNELDLVLAEKQRLDALQKDNEMGIILSLSD
jgi:hypothetical protein